MNWENSTPIAIPHWMSAMVVVALVMAIICNICVLFRFLERHIWHSTILSLITATAQDFLSIGVIIPFCILYPPSKNYVYLEGFWTMIASMAFSLTATVLMSIDLHGTPNFRLQGSGVTHKQRILIAEAMTLCFYLAIGALIFIYIEKWSFSDSLRFAVRARQRKARREARRQERKAVRARAEEKRRRYLETVERIRQMEGKEMPSTSTYGPHYFTHLPRLTIHSGTHLRIPTFFSRAPETTETKQNRGSDSTLEGDLPTTDTIKHDAIEVLHSEPPNKDPSETVKFGEHTPPVMAHTSGMPDDDLTRFMTIDDRDPPKKQSLFRRMIPFGHTKTEITIGAHHSPEKQRELERQQAHEESMEEYGRRLRFSATMFLIFWFGGALIFMLTESWTFFDSLYFCGVSFATIGYGDFVPHTPTGRSIFIAYCLVGVVTLTSLASLMSEVLSKSMRRHVVETQIRRSERLVALGDTRADENQDLENGTTGSVSTEDEADFQRRMDTLNSLVHETSGESSARDNSCKGSLQQVVNVSREFDTLLQKVLGLDSAITEDTSSTAPKSRAAAPKTIRDYIEKSDKDDGDPSYLSPSLSRDISTTSSIHRHSPRPAVIHHSRHFSLDARGSSVNTYHGSSYSSSSDSSQLKIMAWPTAKTPEGLSHLGSENTPSPSPSPSVQSPAVPAPNSSLLRHTKQGTVTLSAVQWHHLIEYSKQFKVLVETCEAAVQKVAAWEANEKRLRQNRRQTRLLQLRALNERRRRLQEEDMHRPLEDDLLDEEDELEALEAWDEEGSQDEEEDEAQDRHRSKISATLLGTSSPKRGRNHSRRRRSRRSSMQEGSSGPRFDPNFLQPPVVNHDIRGRLQAQPSYPDKGVNIRDMSPHPRRPSSRSPGPSRTRRDRLSRESRPGSPSSDVDAHMAPDAPVPDSVIAGTTLVSSPPGSPTTSLNVV
ncbi:hypothetical protein BGZ81_004004 [Podila clonocystis]|nr:hypothetical protein BGZ81_004004 [Podila clonocystis]